MYGFLNTHAKRKAFKKALTNAFDSGYDPSTAADKNANPISLGKTVEPISIDAIRKTKIRSGYNKPETSFVDLSKHKDWRNKGEQNKQSVASHTMDNVSKGASLFDELFPNSDKSESSNDVKKSSTNAMLDNILPDSNEIDQREEFVFSDAKKVEQNETIPNPPSKETEASWEELFLKLNMESLEDSEEQSKQEVEPKAELDVEPKAEEKQVEETPIDIEPLPTIKEEPLPVIEAEPEKVVIEKPQNAPRKTTPKPKPASTGLKKKALTKQSSSAKTKKRKNKIKFDADIIGGW